MSVDESKFDIVRDLLADHRVLVAFSGGVDSSVLAHNAKRWAKDVSLILVNSETIAKEEIDNAKSVASELELDLKVVDFDWLTQGALPRNPIDRCYRCKKALAKLWKKHAKELGFDMVVEGTTATEMSGRRPGEQALREEGITSPFLMADLTKSDLRAYAREHDLSIAERPSMACLATRFPYDTKITEDLLRKIEDFEEKIREETGIRRLRARYHNDIIRIEVAPNERDAFFDKKILDNLHQVGKSFGFQYVTLDLKGYRSGSMDEPFCED
jgi:uncharacterized protein